MENNGIQPKLYLCATPIGNLGDITFRTVKTLEAAEIIYCEDTRNTLKLLNALGIKKQHPLMSCHEHTEQRTAASIASAVREGRTVAFVSDAGMPGVSDPGSRLIREFIKEDLPFEVLPGASAMVTAWVASGLPTESLLFIGFLPRTGAERTAALKQVAESEATVALYESPLRAAATLLELSVLLKERGGNEEKRRCVLMRELTKAFEERIEGTAESLAERFSAEPPRGECVLLVEGTDRSAEADKAAKKLDGLLTTLFGEDVSLKTAVKIACETLDLPKNTVYKRATELAKE